MLKDFLYTVSQLSQPVSQSKKFFVLTLKNRYSSQNAENNTDFLKAIREVC